MKVAEEIYSVSHLTRLIRNLLDDGLPMLWVEGELSNITLHRSGHRYFTLKDAEAQISSVMWRTRPAPGFELKDGMKIRAFGKVTVWERGGRYQLDVQKILPVGVGDLQAAFEELKRKLDAEGLFDLLRKRPLPKYPKAIGIVTSPTGAAIHDLVWGFSSRFPPVDLYLMPVKVQGEGAAEDICGAIAAFNRSDLVDVIVTGRGGGSIEDLWAFNEEIVVRAIAGSGLPIVSAVGHEVDVTLSDLAADLRAPTPTAAAALVVPDRQDLNRSLTEKSTRISRSLRQTVTLWREKIVAVANSYGMKRVINRIAEERLRLDDTSRRLETAQTQRIVNLKRGVEATDQRLLALSPNRVLDKGYCVARKADRTIVKYARNISVGEELDLSFREGGALTTVKEIHIDDGRNKNGN